MHADRKQTWLHVCHTSLLPNPGDFQTVAIANFSILIVRGKDGQLRTFHNACRHRAYPVTNKSNGHANLLMCGYHGWTYNINGKLIQAPKFEGLNGFDKRQNGLFELRSFTDSSGFLYTNADVYGSDGLTIRVGVPLRATLHLVDHWTVEADFNWKIAMAPGVFTVSSLASSKRGLNLFARASANLESWSCPAELQLSPLTRVLRSSTSGLCLTVSMSPISQEKTAIQCALYTSSVRKLEDHLSEAVKRDVEESISRLRDQFTEAVLQGSIPHATHQEPLLAEIKAHSKLERLMGQEIHPASRLRETTQACKVADDLCKELEAEEGKRGRQSQVGGLAW